MINKISFVVPVLNEEENIEIFSQKIIKVLDVLNLKYEVIFVNDNSSDKTQEKIEKVSNYFSNFRGILRIGRTGLASAVIEGICAAKGQYIIVMDGDLQHDFDVLHEIVKNLHKVDIIVVSRDFQNLNKSLSNKRRKISNLGNVILSKFVKSEVSDVLSGYFAINKNFFINNILPKLNNDLKGFKILFEILYYAKDAKVIDIKSKFKSRLHGKSKLNYNIFLDLFETLFNKIFNNLIPWKFVVFVLMGLIGASSHLLVLHIFFNNLEWSFFKSQSLATFTAMTLNFFMNNFITFRENQIYRYSIVLGLVKFYLICSIGAASNIIISNYIFSKDINWLLSGLIGAAIGSVWNFSVSSTIVWKKI